jgi:hypothetical protein
MYPTLFSVGFSIYTYDIIINDCWFDYVFFGLGMILMFVLLFKIIGLFKKQPPQ